MLGELRPVEVEEVLRRQSIGRLGMCGDDTVYVFPVNYGYDGAYLYFVSHEGLKVQLMRAHPHVCVQVDEIVSPAEWRSVLVHGNFEEVQDETQRDKAMEVIFAQSSATPPSIAPYIDGPNQIIIYRLHSTTKTGRYERSQVLALRRQP